MPGKGSGWITDSFVDHTIDISRHKPLSGSSYIKISNELDHPKDGLIIIQNFNDDECLKWYWLRYLHPAYHHPARIRQVDKDFARELDFKIISNQKLR